MQVFFTLFYKMKSHDFYVFLKLQINVFNIYEAVSRLFHANNSKLLFHAATDEMIKDTNVSYRPKSCTNADKYVFVDFVVPRLDLAFCLSATPNRPYVRTMTHADFTRRMLSFVAIITAKPCTKQS